MAMVIEDLGTLEVDTERVDLDTLCVKAVIDLDTLCVKAVIDEDTLCTNFGATAGPTRYRADTTFLTADNTSITADYSY